MSRISLRIADLRKRSRITQQKLGLTNVDVKMHDKAEFITPPSSNYDEIKIDFLAYNHWNSKIHKDEKEQFSS